MTSVSDVVSSRTPALRQLLAQLGGVGEVAVVAERDGAAVPVWRTTGWAFGQRDEPVVE